MSVITVALIYGGIISMDIYRPIKETYLSKMTSYEQVKKNCKKGPTGNSSGIFSLFQKGGNIATELKKLGKKLNN